MEKKVFKTPELEVEKLVVEDIITTSQDEGSNPDYGGGRV